MLAVITLKSFCQHLVDVIVTSFRLGFFMPRFPLSKQNIFRSYIAASK